MNAVDELREYAGWLLIVAFIGFFGGYLLVQQLKTQLLAADPASQLYYYDSSKDETTKSTAVSAADNDQVKAIYANHIVTIGVPNTGCGCPACCGAI